MGFEMNGGIGICQKKMGLIVTVYQIYQENERKKIGFEQTVEQKFAKKNDGFDSNGIIHLLGEREKKDGFWTNGGLEFN